MSIYLLRTHYHEELNKNIFKVGRTSGPLRGRLSGYPKNSIIYTYHLFHDDLKAETEILHRFRKNFKNILDDGAEYFEGDYKQMNKIINDVFMEEKDYRTIEDNKKDETDIPISSNKICKYCNKYDGRIKKDCVKESIDMNGVNLFCEEHYNKLIKNEIRYKSFIFKIKSDLENNKVTHEHKESDKSEEHKESDKSEEHKPEDSESDESEEPDESDKSEEDVIINHIKNETKVIDDFSKENTYKLDVRLKLDYHNNKRCLYNIIYTDKKYVKELFNKYNINNINEASDKVLLELIKISSLKKAIITHNRNSYSLYKRKLQAYIYLTRLISFYENEVIDNIKKEYLDILIHMINLDDITDIYKFNIKVKEDIFYIYSIDRMKIAINNFCMNNNIKYIKKLCLENFSFLDKLEIIKIYTSHSNDSF